MTGCTEEYEECQQQEAGGQVRGAGRMAALLEGLRPGDADGDVVCSIRQLCAVP